MYDRGGNRRTKRARKMVTLPPLFARLGVAPLAVSAPSRRTLRPGIVLVLVLVLVVRVGDDTALARGGRAARAAARQAVEPLLAARSAPAAERTLPEVRPEALSKARLRREGSSPAWGLLVWGSSPVWHTLFMMK